MLFLDVLQMTFKPVMKMKMTFLPAVIALQAILMFLSLVMMPLYAVMTFKHRFDTMSFVFTPVLIHHEVMAFLSSLSVLLLSQKCQFALWIINFWLSLVMAGLFL